jgi:hypothetical protein
MSFSLRSLDDVDPWSEHDQCAPAVEAVEIGELFGSTRTSWAAVHLGDVILTLWQTAIGVQPVIFARLRRLD